MTASPPPPAADYSATRRGALSGVRALMVRHVAIALISLGGTTYLIRELGPERWGGFAIAYLLLVSVDGVLSRALIAGLLRRAVSDDAATLAGAARLIALAGLALAAALAAAPLVLAPWYDPPGLTPLLLAAAACALLYALRALPVTLLERDLRYGPVAAAEIGDMVAFYAVAIPLAASGHGITGLAAGTVARGAVQLVVARSARRAPLIGSGAGPAARRLLPFGLPLAAVLGISTLDGLVPIAVIGSHEREIGFIVVAAQVLGYGVSLVTAVARVGIPSLARLEGAQAMQATRRATEVSTFLTLSALVPVGALAAAWLPAALGGQFEDGVNTFHLIALGVLSAGPIGVWQAALTAAGHSRTVLWAQVATIATYLVSAAVLVAVIGPIGCAAGYAVSRGIDLVLLGAAARWRLGVGPGSVTLALLAAGVGAFALIVAGTERGLPAGLAVTAACALVWLLSFRRLAAASIGALLSRLTPRAPRGGVRLGRRGAVVTAVALAAAGGLVAVQVGARGGQAVFLSSPIPLAPGVHLVAAEVEPVIVPVDGVVAVRLYLEGGGALPRPPRVLITSNGLEVPPESEPDLSRRRASVRGLRRLDVRVPVPAYMRRRPGTYVLRVAGHAPTFGLVRLVPPGA